MAPCCGAKSYSTGMTEDGDPGASTRNHLRRKHLHPLLSVPRFPAEAYLTERSSWTLSTPLSHRQCPCSPKLLSIASQIDVDKGAVSWEGSIRPFGIPYWTSLRILAFGQAKNGHYNLLCISVADTISPRADSPLDIT